jgi:diguanylate cyclase (GGDEF)-like protein
VWLHLDGFGARNEHLGGGTRDEVLVAVAQRLAATLRPADILARVGADEYTVLLQDTTERAALAVADRILDAIRHPIAIASQQFTPSASAGVALSRAGDDARAVVTNAKAALAKARAAGGGRQVLYS